MNDTFERLRVLLVKDYELDPATLTQDATLETLGIDSLGVAELMFNVEDEFKVAIPGEPVSLATVGDVVRYIDGLDCGPACSRFSKRMRRVAVTGIGIVSPLGNTAADAIANARSGRSGIHRLEKFADRMTAPLAASADFAGEKWFPAPRLRMLDRFSQFALVAADQALGTSQIDLATIDRQRAGVFLGTGMGGTLTSDDGYKTLYGDQSDRIKPYTVLMGMHNAAAAWIAIEHDLRGPNFTYSTACSSSAVAIGEAWRRVAGGDVDFAIAGGAEAPLSLGSLKAWEALHTLASVDGNEPSASCKPFAGNRTGMVLGEGAAMVVLEPWTDAIARGAPVLGEIVGYGFSNDTSHITRPSVEGQVAAMRAALVSAAIEPGAIDAINAHGTGTPANDRVETRCDQDRLRRTRLRDSDQRDQGDPWPPAWRRRGRRMCAFAAGHATHRRLADDAFVGARSGVRSRLRTECGSRRCCRAHDAVELVCFRGRQCRAGITGGSATASRSLTPPMHHRYFPCNKNHDNSKYQRQGRTSPHCARCNAETRVVARVLQRRASRDRSGQASGRCCRCRGPRSARAHLVVDRQ